MYSILKTVKKIIKYGILIGVPFLATNYPDVLNLTIGGALILVYDYIKHGKGIKRLP